MNDIKRFSQVKPSITTPFCIDFEWWRQHDNDSRIYLQSCLCPEHQETFSKIDTDIKVDWVDPQTAEVQLVDGLQHVLMSHCAQLPGFLTNRTSLVDTVFRVFLANGNLPLTPEDLSKQIDRPAETILRTLTGPQIYKGLHPCAV
jgi:hypothetical protein